MNCEAFEALLDKENKTPQDQREMDRHMEECPDCRMLYELRALGEDNVPEDVHALFVQSGAERKDTDMDKKKVFNIVKRVGAIAAALVFLLAGANYVSELNLSSGGSANKSASVSATYNNTVLFDADTAAVGLARDSAPRMATKEAADNAVLYEEAADYAEIPAAGTMENGSTQKEKIIRTVTMTVKTTDFDQDLAALRVKAEALGGHVESLSVSGDKAQNALRSASITLRIPAENLDSYLAETDSLTGRVTSSTETQEDVSASYYDTETRLNTQKAKLARLQEMMAKALKISDLIEIESAISDTQYYIDSYTGTLNRYDSKVNYSTVSISLREESVRESIEAPDNSFFTRLKNGIVTSLKDIAEFGGNLVIFLIMALPWLAAAAMIIIVIRVIVKKRKSRAGKTKE